MRVSLLFQQGDRAAAIYMGAQMNFLKRELPMSAICRLIVLATVLAIATSGIVFAETMSDHNASRPGQAQEMTHLAAHLETRAILIPEQVALYDKLRGYTRRARQATITPASTSTDSSSMVARSLQGA